MIELNKQCILLEMKAASREEALAELAELVHVAHPQITRKAINTVLSEREQLGSTGVGNGVAIPHARLEGLDSLTLCLGRSSRGISFDAVDNRPVHLFVMILSPATLADGYLESLAGVSKLLKNENTRDALLQAEDVERIVALFNG